MATTIGFSASWIDLSVCRRGIFPTSPGSSLDHLPIF